MKRWVGIKMCVQGILVGKEPEKNPKISMLVRTCWYWLCCLYLQPCIFHYWFYQIYLVPVFANFFIFLCPHCISYCNQHFFSSCIMAWIVMVRYILSQVMKDCYISVDFQMKCYHYLHIFSETFLSVWRTSLVVLFPYNTAKKGTLHFAFHLMG